MATIQPESSKKRRAMSVRDFCAEYGVSRSKAYELFRDGAIRPVKVGIKTLIRVDDAEAWLASLPKRQEGAQ